MTAARLKLRPEDWRKAASLDGFGPEILRAVATALEVWGDFGELELVVTHGTDGKHGPRSFHLQGKAVDIRSRGLAHVVAMLAQLREQLGADYDVVHEDAGGLNEHIHIEHDPPKKGGAA